MNKKAKRTPLGWVATSSGTYHLRVEIAGKATRRVVACGAHVEKGADIVDAPPKGVRVCQTCFRSPLLDKSVRWGRAFHHGGNIETSPGYKGYATLSLWGASHDPLCATLTMRQVRKLHEKLGDYIEKVDPPQTATVTITSYPPHRHESERDNIIPAIKCVRDHLGLDLQKAVALIKNQPLPIVVFDGDRNKAKALTKALKGFGVGVEIE